MLNKNMFLLKSSLVLLFCLIHAAYGAKSHPEINEDFQDYLHCGISAFDSKLVYEDRRCLINQAIFGGANFGAISIGDFQFFQGVFYTKTQEYLDAVSYAEYKNKMRRNEGKEPINKLIYKLRYFCREGNLLGAWVTLSCDQSKIFEISPEPKNTEDIDLLIDQNWEYYESLYGDLWKEYDGDDKFFASIDWYNRVLFEAAKNDDLLIAYWCWKHNANLDFEGSRTDSPRKNGVFIEAAGWGSLRVLRFLIDCKANINIKSTTSGRTALHAACKWAQPDSVKILIAAGAKNYTDRARLTPYRLVKKELKSKKSVGTLKKTYELLLKILKENDFK